jgi:hypothetical protein
MAAGLNQTLYLLVAQARTVTLLFVFVQHKRLTAVFADKDWTSIILSLWTTIALGINAIGLAWLIDHPTEFKLDTASFIQGIYIFIAVATFVRSYLPSYRPTSQYIEPLFPVSKGIRTSANLLFDLVSPYSLNMMLFCGILFATAQGFTVWHLATTLCILFAAMFLDRSLKLIMEYTLRFSVAHSVILAVSSVVFVLGLWSNVEGLNGIQSSMTTMIGRAMLLCFVGLYHLLLVATSIRPRVQNSRKAQSHIITQRNAATVNHSSWSSWLHLVLQAYYRTPHIRTLLVIAFVVKYGFFVFFFVVLEPSPEKIQRARYFIAYLGSSAFFFSYLFLNTFGMIWQLWQTVHIQDNRRSAMVKLYCGIVVPLLFIDTTLSLGIVTFAGLLTFNYVLYVTVIECTLFASGWAVSLLSPIKHETMPNLMGWKNQTVSRVGGFIVVLLVVLPALAPRYIPQYEWLPVALSILVCGIGLILTVNYRHLSFKFYHALHR